MEHEQRDPFAQRDNDDVGIRFQSSVQFCAIILEFKSHFVAISFVCLCLFLCSCRIGIAMPPRSTNYWSLRREATRKGK